MRDDSIAIVPLTQGMSAIVDKDDVHIIEQYKWHVCWDNRGKVCYARANGARPTKIKMHRLIMGAKQGQIVDHINGDGLDNRRENLRICSKAENCRNRRGANNNSSTGYIGVIRRNGKYQARVTKDGKIYYAGEHLTPEDAAHARDQLAIEIHGEFLTLNFPME